MSFLLEQLEADRLRNRDPIQGCFCASVRSAHEPDSSAKIDRSDSSLQTNDREGNCEASRHSARRIQQHLGPLARLKRQEGVAQVNVNRERALCRQYQEVIAASLQYLTTLLNSGKTTASGFQAKLDDALSQFMLDRERLFEQDRVLQHVESTLAQIQYRVAEIIEQLDQDINSIFPALEIHEPHGWELVDEPSETLQEPPDSVDQYYYELQKASVLEDRLSDLFNDRSWQLRTQSEMCGQAMDQLEGTGESETLYKSRKLALEAELESSRMASVYLRERCLAEGRDPDIHRFRRSSSCSTRCIAAIDRDRVGAYDEEVDAVRIV